MPTTHNVYLYWPNMMYLSIEINIVMFVFVFIFVCSICMFDCSMTIFLFYARFMVVCVCSMI